MRNIFLLAILPVLFILQTACSGGGGGGAPAVPTFKSLIGVAEDGLTGNNKLIVYSIDDDEITELTDPNTSDVDSDDEVPPVQIGNLVYFISEAVTANAAKIWVYDPAAAASSANPKQLFSLNGPTVDDEVSWLRAYEGKLYFSGIQSSVYKTFVYDPHAAVSGTNPKALFDDWSENLLISDDKMYFTSYTAPTGMEVHVFDMNQAAGASNPLVIDINSGGGSSSPGAFTAVNGKIYFSAFTTATGGELFVYDPDVAVSGSNPQVVYDMEPGANSSYPYGLKLIDGKLYYGASTTATGGELVIFDPAVVASGTNPKIIDVNSGSSNGYPSYFTAVGNKVIFSANSASSGNELYIYNPAQAISGSNPLLVDVMAGAASSSPWSPVTMGDQAFINIYDGSAGHLVSYDSTAAVSVGTNPELVVDWVDSPDITVLIEFTK